MTRAKQLWLHAVCLLILPALVLAQGTGTIHGTVTDPSGAPVPGAKVTAMMVERAVMRTLVTNVQGDYVLPSMPIGTYSISVEAPGFKISQRPDVELTANQNVRVDVRLEVGTVTESLMVSTQAPLVDSRSSVVGTLIDSRRVLDLPMNGRNVIALAALLPGASQISAPQTFTGDRSGPTLSMSGSRANQNSLLFDGAYYTALFRNTGLNYPPPDALQEVKVLTNTYSAEYGRNSGAVFNVVTRSGTNEFHGSTWEFLRNHNLNARNFFAPSQKPKLIQNQFGGAVGGPIRKDKLFFFASYEGLRIRPAALGASAFPLTQAERAGDFSASRSAVRDPLTNQPLPNNQIPAARIDPVARNLISRNLMPLPNQPDGQLVTTTSTPQGNDQLLARLDYSVGRHTIEGRYNNNYATLDSFVGQVPEYQPVAQPARTQLVSIGDTFIVRPNLLNQIRLSYSRFANSLLNLNQTHLADLGSNLPIIGPKTLSAISIAGRISLGVSSSADIFNVNESLQFLDSVTWTKSNHSLKAGFELLKLRFHSRTFERSQGSFSMSGQITGNAAADFILGAPVSMTIASPGLEQGVIQTNTYYYIQDDWRLHPRLTMNIGLRYELSLPWVHPHDFWAAFRLGQQSQKFPGAPVGMVYPGDPGIPRGLVDTDRNNVAPRIGFAWDPFGNGRTSVRAAYGIFYDTSAANADIIQNNNTQPFRYGFTFPTPYSLSDPLRGLPRIPATVNLVDPIFVGLPELSYPVQGLRTAYLHHFNLNIQRELVRDLAVQVA
jgi:outer membrane receptor protein involved in Fe transport